MTKESRDFYFGVNILVNYRFIKYHFKLYKNEEVLYYFKTGVKDTFCQGKEFIIVVDFEPSKWSYRAIMYQIYIDRFYNGDKNNDVLTNEYGYLGKMVKKADNWDDFPTKDDYRRFYGGDL